MPLEIALLPVLQRGASAAALAGGVVRPCVIVLQQLDHGAELRVTGLAQELPDDAQEDDHFLFWVIVLQAGDAGRFGHPDGTVYPAYDVHLREEVSYAAPLKTNIFFRPQPAL